MSADRTDREHGLEEGDDGERIGRDPRRMTHAELRALGHEPMSPLAALRARCLDCAGGSSSEVRKCTAVECPAWPFRMSASPWRAPASEAQREAGRRLAARRARKSKIPGNGRSADAGTATPVLPAA
jgi:hypothetical protein